MKYSWHHLPRDVLSLCWRKTKAKRMIFKRTYIHRWIDIQKKVGRRARQGFFNNLFEEVLKTEEERNHDKTKFDSCSLNRCCLAPGHLPVRRNNKKIKKKHNYPLSNLLSHGCKFLINQVNPNPQSQIFLDNKINNHDTWKLSTFFKLFVFDVWC